MKKILLFFSVMALTASAFAQEAEIKTHAEIRTRWFDVMDAAGAQAPGGTTNTGYNGTDDYLTQRNLIGITMRKGEHVGAQITLINTMNWGDDAGNSVGNSGIAMPNGISGSTNSNNLLTVNEAWGWWKASDSLTLKLGRGGLTMADGSVVSRYDWGATPYSLDGALLNWDLEPVSVSFFAVRLADFDKYAGSGSGGQIEHNDAQSNLFGIAVDGKNLPDWLNIANLHIFQVNADQMNTATPGESILTDGVNETRYGIALKGAASSFDYHLDAAMETGNLVDNLATTTKINLNTNMIDLELGYNLPDLMKFHIYANYHVDSGDSDYQNTASTSSTAGADNKWGRYNGFLYDSHQYGGLMDIVRWGNLSYWQVGASVSPMDQTEIGIKYTDFSRTSKNDAITCGDMGAALCGVAANGTMFKPSADGAGQADIGTEFDLEASHNFDSAFSTQLIAGWFTPGKYLQNGYAATTAGANVNKTITSLMLQGTMTF